MLMPKRVKRRRVHRGRMKGQATRGNKITYGDYAIQALEPAWITANQIEAARVAMTRYIKRGVRFGLRFFRTNRLLPNQPKRVWVPVKGLQNTGWPL